MVACGVVGRRYWAGWYVEPARCENGTNWAALIWNPLESARMRLFKGLTLASYGRPLPTSKYAGYLPVVEQSRQRLADRNRIGLGDHRKDEAVALIGDAGSLLRLCSVGEFCTVAT